MSVSFQTPLRYPGGKARLGPWIAWLMRHNEISGGTYVEAYAGGAGAAMYLLLNRYVDKIIINDLDPSINKFWKACLYQSDDFIKLVKSTPVTLKEREKQLKILSNHQSESTLKLGFATFFLNRVNRSGILSGGVIGGLEQKGNYKIDARFNKSGLIQRIEKLARFKERITVHSEDALDFLDIVEKDLEPNSLIYLDPPYYNKASQLYRNFYKPEDHELVAKRINSIKTPWIVTYDNCPEIRALYHENSSCEFSLTYSTNKDRPLATELLIYNRVDLPKEPLMYRSSRPYPSKWTEMDQAHPKSG